MAERGGVYKRCGCVNPADGRRWGLRCPRLGRRGHGLWCFTVELPTGADGRRQRLRRGGFDTRAAAEAARGYWLGEEVDADLSVVTVGQWLDIWLQTRVVLRPSTQRIYTQLVRDYLVPHLGGIPLRELTVARTQAMFTALLRANQTRTRPLSATTLQRIREVLRAALNAAIRLDLITTNPARWVELPAHRRPRAVVWTDARVALWRMTGQRPAIAVWTASHTAAFLAHARGHELAALFHLTALLGPRRGEVIGVRWSDVDFTDRTLTICRQIQEINGRATICLPKSETSTRTVALDRGTLALLRGLHSRWMGATGGVVADGWIFAHDGRHWSPSYISHVFRTLTKDADLPPIRFHDLRHGAASLCLAAGNELKTVQALLGHASIVLTADTYTSVLPCLAHHAAEATAQLIRRAGHDRWAHPRRRARKRPARHNNPAKPLARRARTRSTGRPATAARPHIGHTPDTQIDKIVQKDPQSGESRWSVGQG